VYGFDNISANNGWAMAFVGATTVFAGLVVLSFVISQIYKILELWDRKDQLMSGRRDKTRAPEAPKVEAPRYKVHHLASVEELKRIYRPLVEQLDESFELMQLYQISYKMDLPHPHLSINRLREANVLAAREDGKFIWQN
jgi:hypothetical protein